MYQSSKIPRPEPGSFRDRDSRVYLNGDKVYRSLSPEGQKDWADLEKSSFFHSLLEDEKLVQTKEAEGVDWTQSGDFFLEHEKLPFISYPYEWSFAMLKDAALLQLDIMEKALQEGMMLKDATPYNVQFVGTSPQFIDLGSFYTLDEAEPWRAYRQFCSLYLYPLMIQAYRNIPFQPWMRGSLEGIEPIEASAVLRGKDLFRPGVLFHVKAHAALDRRAKKSGPDASKKPPSSKREALLAQTRSMNKLVQKINWSSPETSWSDYRDDNTYDSESEKEKKGFVLRALREVRPTWTWDMGCNDGEYSRLAAEESKYVLALDFDQASIDNLYKRLKLEGQETIFPLVQNIADPSPGLGWRGIERSPVFGRSKPDLVLALALIHHLSISAHVPLAEIVDWLASLAQNVVVEFPHRDDPMVQSLLIGKADGSNSDYNQDVFENLINERFHVTERRLLSGGTRTMYFLQRKYL